ncbi:MAG: hypothetical protein MK185_00865 [Saccharospirillaceae bacterium]|nr:hypothetical protein A3759_08370 [Thalassolituus sp. HI0120]MCH2039173.1 hypothetical protein [Saccharospirillaceae bacterium]
MWEIIHDWSDVCYPCNLKPLWQQEFTLLFFLVGFGYGAYRIRQQMIEDGKASSYWVAFPISFLKKIKFPIWLPFFLVGFYSLYHSIFYTYEVLTDQYIDREYNRLEARLEEGPTYCVQGQHAESYLVKTGKRRGDHYVKFDSGDEFYTGVSDTNRRCFGIGEFFYREFYDVKEKLGTDQVEFKMCWVVDVDDKRSLSVEGGGKCIFELKYRALEPSPS